MAKLINPNHRAYKKRSVPRTPQTPRGQQTSKQKAHQPPKVQNHWRDSTDYRREYFRKNKGLCGLYFCSQCMRAMFRNDPNLEVDHIFPPSRMAKKNKAGTKNTSILSVNLNSTWNCVPICSDCNKKKSDKVGLVTVKGIAAKLITTTRLGLTGLGARLFRGVWNRSVVSVLRLCGRLGSHVCKGQHLSVVKRKRFRGGRRFGR